MLIQQRYFHLLVLSLVALTIFAMPRALEAAQIPYGCTGAYATPNISPDDYQFIEDDVDKLVASGLVDKFLYGERPFSFRDLVRIFQSADAHIQNSDLPNQNPDRYSYFRSILDRRDEELHFRKMNCPDHRSSIWFNPLKEIQFSYLSSTGPRLIPRENGVGLILAADTDPLNEYRNGQTFTRGHLLDLDLQAEAEITPYLSFFARPRLEMVINQDSRNELNFIPQEYYLKTGFSNIEVQLGRSSLKWGMREFGGLLLSDNARPFEMIKITNPIPVINPWIFKYLGPTKYSLVLGNLGPNQKHAWPYFFGIRLDFAPTKNVEFGFHQTFMMGGRGADNMHWYEIFSEMVGKKQNWGIGDGRNVSDQRAGMDGLIRLPFLHHLQWYYDVAMDDGGSGFIYFLQNLSYSTGFYLPMLDAEGRMNLRLEYSYTSPIMYRHEDWGGYTLERHMIGENLTSDCYEVRLKYGWDIDSKSHLNVTAAWEQRSNDMYQFVYESDGISPDHYYTLTERPKENSVRVLGEYVAKINDKLSLSTRLGIEEVHNYNFRESDNKVNLTGGLGLQLHNF